MLIFVLGVSIVCLIVEREAQPYLKPETSQSVYILQWQVVLFMQALLLLDASLTDSLGRAAIGIGLLVVNLFLIGIILFGARETLRRA